MGGLSIAFRRRTQYKKRVEKVDIIIYDTLTLTSGAQILMDDVWFRDNIIETKFAYGGSQSPALYGVDANTGVDYILAKTNNGSYKGARNGGTAVTQYFLSGFDYVHKWASDGVYVGGTIRVTEERTARDWMLKFLCSESLSTKIYYMDVYDISGKNLLHSIKPALLNKETPGLWDEVNQKFYGMTSETGTLTLA